MLPSIMFTSIKFKYKNIINTIFFPHPHIKAPYIYILVKFSTIQKTYQNQIKRIIIADILYTIIILSTIGNDVLGKCRQIYNIRKIIGKLNPVDIPINHVAYITAFFSVGTLQNFKN